ncbi:polysaccharide biosynthesis protein [Paraclostridium bifermentans]|uniref:lipopolysaccharide biosynthesis protein n=1 Tax=Paraclostridium bifermentans TaxID=1490 RepID=UPI0021C28059|nr:oligosaccharide flippase family protein [Paraclostridium bifermentans]GKZ04394.1 polysaccharide biosynthesis protein [Paraclostridium bifermentans]GKZ05237.1 polysaccharide biosynthesis protein [Paraclostridium bifermentans]GKZ11296.1 polysaccharide biosynthesis protein [Paraclostridium bifermentans]
MDSKFVIKERNKELILNSIILGVGSIGTKLIQMLLIPIFSYMLSPKQYGEIDLIINTSQLIIPIISLGIIEAIFRFTMDSSEDKSFIYSTSMMIIFVGLVVLFITIKLIGIDRYEYISLMFMYTVSNIFYSSNLQFARALEKIKLYMLTTFLVTLVMLLLNILFVVKLHLGVSGYITSSILSNILGILNIFIFSGNLKYFNIKKISIKNSIRLLHYSVPTVVNTISWWITNVSDRYIITFILGVSANGLYSMACKIPSIMSLFTSVFSQAWQISAIKEHQKNDLENFYSEIFNKYAFSLIIATSVIISIIKPVSENILDSNYKNIWIYVPFLIISAKFSAISSFVGTIYTARKKNFMVTLSTIIGAVLNIILNIILIPKLGINGASIATLVSYICVVVFRIIDTNKYISLNINYKKYIYSVILIILQSILLILNKKATLIISNLICIFILFKNRSILNQIVNIVYIKRLKFNRNRANKS